jgi:hypothetical protein
VTRAELDEVIRTTLTDRELEFERTGEGSYLVSLPGTHRLATPCWLVVGDHALLVEAFVMRHADEGHAELYDFLLQRNSRIRRLDQARVGLAGQARRVAGQPPRVRPLRRPGRVLDFAPCRPGWRCCVR